jgi:hypothetical protein
MNPFLLYGLVGLASGVVVFPVGLWIFLKFRNTFERRRVKRMLKRGQFLIPIDPKDFDTTAWQGKRYGNINVNDYKDDLENFNLKIFRRIKVQEDDPFEDKRDKVNEDFLKVAIGYLKKAKELGYDDDFIKGEFRKKNYNEELIRRIYEM